MSENYLTKSQATYFFDCDGNGIKDGKINPNSSKGSFCCILQRLKYETITVKENNNEIKKLKEIDNPSIIISFDEKISEETLPKYYILTAGHNLSKEKNSYRLINHLNSEEIISLTIDDNFKIINESFEKEGKDAAILTFDYNKTSKNFKDNLIRFENKYYDNNRIVIDDDFVNNFFEEENKNDKKGEIVGQKQIVRDNVFFKNEKVYSPTTPINCLKTSYFELSKAGEPGCSGGSVFRDDIKKLLGIYIGSNGINGYSQTYYSLATILKDFKIV